MKLNELFVSERISLATHASLIDASIRSGVWDGLNQVYYKLKKYPEEKRAKVNAGEFDEIGRYVAHELLTQFRVLVPVSIAQNLTAKLNMPIMASTRQLGNEDAYADNNRIVYNIKLIVTLVNTVIDQVSAYTLEHQSSSEPLFDTLQNAFIKMTASDIFSSDNVKRIMHKLVSVTLHELTHVIQHIKQGHAGRQSFEYRSYIEPNKKKFKDLVTRLSAESPSERDYRIYQASPQEIAAFAQQEALEIIKSNNIKTTKDIGKNINQVITTRAYNIFKDPKTPAEYRVFKRFNKLVYQSIIDYVEGK